MTVSILSVFWYFCKLASKLMCEFLSSSKMSWIPWKLEEYVCAFSAAENEMKIMIYLSDNTYKMPNM